MIASALLSAAASLWVSALGVAIFASAVALIFYVVGFWGHKDNPVKHKWKIAITAIGIIIAGAIFVNRHLVRPSNSAAPTSTPSQSKQVEPATEPQTQSIAVSGNNNQVVSGHNNVVDGKGDRSSSKRNESKP